MEFYRILLKKESTGTTRTTAQISITAIMWPLFQLKYLEFTMFSTEKQLGIVLICRLLTFFTILQFCGGISRHTLAEIGRLLEVSRERVRQVELKALRKLRNLTRKLPSGI